MIEKNILCKRAKHLPKKLPVLVHIGKFGITPHLLNEIKKHLKKKEIVKIKMLKSFIADKDRFEVATQIAEKTDSKLIDIKGFVIVLYKR